MGDNIVVFVAIHSDYDCSSGLVVFIDAVPYAAHSRMRCKWWWSFGVGRFAYINRHKFFQHIILISFRCGWCTIATWPLHSDPEYNSRALTHHKHSFDIPTLFVSGGASVALFFPEHFLFEPNGHPVIRHRFEINLEKMISLGYWLNLNYLNSN